MLWQQLRQDATAELATQGHSREREALLAPLPRLQPRHGCTHYRTILAPCWHVQPGSPTCCTVQSPCGCIACKTLRTHVCSQPPCWCQWCLHVLRHLSAQLLGPLRPQHETHTAAQKHEHFMTAATHLSTAANSNLHTVVLRSTHVTCFCALLQQDAASTLTTGCCQATIMLAGPGPGPHGVTPV